MVERWKCVGYCVHCSADQDDSTFSKEWGHFEKASDGAWVRADTALALAAELAECRNSRQREHDLRVTIAGELESFKIRYQDEVNARVDAENDRDTLRTGYVSELRKVKAELATARIAALASKGSSLSSTER
jgi:hypothetical protein